MATICWRKAIAFLQQMVAIPSVTGDEAKIQKFLADYMTKIGLDVDVWETDWEALKKHPAYRPVNRGYEGRPNIVATLKGSGGGRSVLLNGHTDVIPVGGGEGWSDDPWSATINTAVLYGGGPWIVAPSLPAAHRDDIGMPVQEQGSSPARAL